MQNPKKETSIFDDLIKKIIPIIPKRVTPNHITMLRLILIPILILVFLFNHFLLAFIIFLIASFSDAIDGALARQRQMITKIGSALDPLIDKILIIALIILFAKCLPWQIVEILIISELATIGGGYALHKNKKKIKANIFGKLKMNAEILGIILLFAKLIYKINYLDQVITIIFLFVIIFSFTSFLKTLKDS
ncbi:MAG: CDP-alcohol phosphatidyltransferase family protein [bacterium]